MFFVYSVYPPFEVAVFGEKINIQNTIYYYHHYDRKKSLYEKVGRIGKNGTDRAPKTYLSFSFSIVFIYIFSNCFILNHNMLTLYRIWYNFPTENTSAAGAHSCDTMIR